MTHQDIGEALELLHGRGMSFTEVAAACGCTVRELEVIDKEVMEFRNRMFFRGNLSITLQSKDAISSIPKIIDFMTK